MIGPYSFGWNFETGKVLKLEDISLPPYGVRYNKENNFVEIGNFRNLIQIESNSWNRVLKVIRDDELDKSGIEAILSLMGNRLPEEYRDDLIKAIKSGKIKETNLRKVK